MFKVAAYYWLKYHANKKNYFGGGNQRVSPYLQTKTIIPNHFNKDTAAFILVTTFCGPFTCISGL